MAGDWDGTAAAEARLKAEGVWATAVGGVDAAAAAAGCVLLIDSGDGGGVDTVVVDAGEGNCAASLSSEVSRAHLEHIPPLASLPEKERRCIKWI